MQELKIDESILHKAILRILPEGYKPEDYAIVNEQYPLKIAIMIWKEYNHLISLNSQSE